ncbi:MAG: hypothetical protein HOU81_04720 [Hamadaea sp.]|uniref:YbaB/EbfC family nucleoid-associated protein n=1 Tax=Hamadaea sp. TaxID=2024425 RepID=UPI0017BCA9CE|nr:YbaB/EbfC family nucleoid-associated protein [Hamadaea sp.]NUR70100.1 hypothetical protein [Hamadaea sp.]NUT21448.1 hypothetical protein [Hamadaea sp.]
MAQLFDIDEGLRQAAAEARQQSARLAALTSAEVSGSDAGGAVAVTVRADGAFVALSLHDEWRKRSGGDLSAAVVAALAAAQQSATEAWSAAVAYDSPQTLDLPGESAPSTADSGDPALFAQSLDSLLQQVEERLAELPDRAAEAATRVVEATGPAGGVIAVAREGALVRVDCDERWLAEAPRTRIEAELTAALAKALPGLRNQVDAAIRVGPVGELLDLAADPAALFRKLGLTT